MKIETIEETKKTFEPIRITITITIESEDELKGLWCYMNHGPGAIKESQKHHEGMVNFDWFSDDLWAKLNQLCVARGLR